VKALHFIILMAIALIVVAAAVWITSPGTTSVVPMENTRQKPFDTTPRYDTSGGQEMRPRWKD
jgi:Ti type entry exclusion protein TrbK